MALILCLVSLKEAWAGISLYRGEQALRRKDNESAYRYLNEAVRFDRKNIFMLESRAKASWNLAKKENSLKAYARSHEDYRQLSDAAPFSGKAVLYTALSKKALYAAAGAGLTSGKWSEIKKLLETALSREPGSAWMAYMAAKTYAENASKLSGEERERMIELFRQSASAKNINKTSPYLTGALSALWKNTSDFDELQKIVPRDLRSYKKFLEFIDQQKFWAHRAGVSMRYRKWRTEEYEEKSRQAEKLLSEGDFQKAKILFQEAVWLDSSLLYAKAGLFIAGKPQNEDLLRKILEEENEDLKPLFDFMENMLTAETDDYLQGLYAFRKGDLSEAIERLSAAKDGKFRRRYLAAAYKELNKLEQAKETLLPAMAEKTPDLRDLYLLREISGNKTAEMDAKIAQAATSLLSPAVWYGKDMRPGVFERKGKQGVVLNLKPGTARIRARLRRLGNESGYFIFRLQGRWSGEALVDSSEGKDVLLEVNTTGGKVWFEAEMISEGTKAEVLSLKVENVK